MRFFESNGLTVYKHTPMLSQTELRLTVDADVRARLKERWQGMGAARSALSLRGGGSEDGHNQLTAGDASTTNEPTASQPVALSAAEQAKSDKSKRARDQREAAQTQRLEVVVILGPPPGYGVGIGDEDDGHCLIRRLVATAYEGSNELQIDDRIISVSGVSATTFDEVLAGIQKRPERLQLVVMRDPTIEPPKGWLQDRITNYLASHPTVSRVLNALWWLLLMLFLMAIGYGFYLLSTAEDIDWEKHNKRFWEAQQMSSPFTRFSYMQQKSKEIQERMAAEEAARLLAAAPPPSPFGMIKWPWAKKEEL